jgi:hypothetical protein
MTQEEVIRLLDEIESRDPDPSFDAGAFDLMSELAQTVDGLRLLVERYSGSPSANIAGSLALLLAEIADKSTTETAPLIFEFVARLRRSDHAGALGCSLTAMRNQIGFGAGWGDTPRPPASLFPFLKHCLNYSGRAPVFVQSGAVDVITGICWCGLLNSAFKSDELKWILERINQLSETDNDFLRDYIVEFEQCLSEKKQL